MQLGQGLARVGKDEQAQPEQRGIETPIGKGQVFGVAGGGEEVGQAFLLRAALPLGEHALGNVTGQHPAIGQHPARGVTGEQAGTGGQVKDVFAGCRCRRVEEGGLQAGPQWRTIGITGSDAVETRAFQGLEAAGIEARGGVVCHHGRSPANWRMGSR